MVVTSEDLEGKLFKNASFSTTSQKEAKVSNDRNTFKLLGGYVDRVTDWCVTGPGFAPRRVQL